MKLPLTITAVLALAAVVAWVAWRELQISGGEKAFAAAGCAQCHLAGGAPGLHKVATKFDRRTLARFIHDPEQIYRERNVRPLNEGYMPMPKIEVSADDAQAIAIYLISRSK